MNGTEPHMHGHSVRNSGAPQDREESTVFAASSAGSAREPPGGRGEGKALDPYLTPHTKLQVQRRFKF